MRILIVDDSPIYCIALKGIVEKLGHSAQTCSNGQLAWEAVNREPFDVVLVDWVMPEMDGVSLCRKIREANFENYIYLILCTSKDKPADYVEAMAAGADDFSVKPPRADEISVRLRAAARIGALQRKLQDKNRLLQSEHAKLMEAYQRIESDLAAAGKELESHLPSKCSAEFGLPTWYHFSPSHFLGGDFLNYFRLSKDHLAFYVLDVAGHGIPAALRASNLSRTLTPSRGLLWNENKNLPAAPSEVAAELNRTFMDDGDYFTLLYATLDMRSLKLDFVQAGHPGPVLLRDGQPQALGEGGFPIALLEQASYEDKSWQLQKGDRLFLYSDGLVEVESEPGQMFGDERLIEVFGSLSSETLEMAVDSTISEVREFCSGLFNDDLSLFGVEIP